MSLATEYRPHTFDDVVGQEVIIRTLKNQIETKTFKNAYIFSGASGCGKTTVARIFANAINGGKGAPIELDAASNSGVDNIRTIIKSASERSLNSEYKVIIIDECHSLTSQAEEALLKTIEEPPKYTIFILCTTDPQKIRDTIKNRCMRFQFSTMTTDQIKFRLSYIANERGIIVDNESYDYISRLAKGSMRNSISLMETALDYVDDNNLTIDAVIKSLGSVQYDEFVKLLYWLIEKDRTRVLSILGKIFVTGVSPITFLDSFTKFVLEIFKCDLLGITYTSIPRTLECTINKINEMDGARAFYDSVVEELLDLKFRLRGDEDAETTIEMNFIKMCI